MLRSAPDANAGNRPIAPLAPVRWVALAAMAVPPLAALVLIYRFGVNGAMWDHLPNAEMFERYYTGDLTLEYFFRPHNEHIKAFTRVVCLALGLASGFDNVVEMYAEWLVLALIAVVVGAAIRRRPGAGVPALLACLPIPFALFNLRQYEALLTGDGMLFYTTIAGVAVAFTLLTDRLTPARVAGATAAALAASFSHATGVLAWPLGILALAAGARKRAPGSNGRALAVAAIVVWLVVGAGTIGVYVWRLPSSAGAAAGQALGQPLQKLGYVIAAAGVSFGANPTMQLAAGAATTALELVIVAAIVRRWRGGSPIPWGIWLVGFGAASRVLIALGRTGNVSSRYVTFMTLSAIGAYAAALEIEKAGARRRLSGAAAVLIGAAWLFGSLDGWHFSHLERGTRLRAVQLLETTRLQTDGAIESLLYPLAAHARVYAEILERRGFNVFAERPVDPATLPRSAGGRFFVDAINGAPFRGPVEVAGDGEIRLAGWALDERGRATFDGLYLVVDGTTAIPAAYGLDRADVMQALGDRRYNRSGFEVVLAAATLTPGEHTLALQGVTADGRTITSDPLTTVRRR